MLPPPGALRHFRLKIIPPLRWGLPEVILFADDRETRISYPDFIEDGTRLFITETQKSVARVHEVPDWLLSRLWDVTDSSPSVIAKTIL